MVLQLLQVGAAHVTQLAVKGAPLEPCQRVCDRGPRWGWRGGGSLGWGGVGGALGVLGSMTVTTGGYLLVSAAGKVHFELLFAGGIDIAHVAVEWRGNVGPDGGWCVCEVRGGLSSSRGIICTPTPTYTQVKMIPSLLCIFFPLHFQHVSSLSTNPTPFLHSPEWDVDCPLPPPHILGLLQLCLYHR